MFSRNLHFKLAHPAGDTNSRRVQPHPASKNPPHDRRCQALKCARPAAALQAATNRRKALRLRLRGFSFRRIGQELGVTASTAHAYVQVAWERLNQDTDRLRRKLRQQELAKLDTLFQHYWPLATKDHLKPLDPAQGPDGPMVIKQADFEEQLHAVDQVTRIITRRSVLLGLLPHTAEDPEDEPQEPVFITLGENKS